MAPRVWLIKAGNSGLGRAVASALARKGAEVVTHYLREAEDDAREVTELSRAVGQPAKIARLYASLANSVSRFKSGDIFGSSGGKF